MKQMSLSRSNGEHCDFDAALMLCCVSGNMPLLPPDDLDDENCPTGRQHIVRTIGLSILKQLSPYAIDWQETENFISEVREISQAKVREAEEALAADVSKEVLRISKRTSWTT